MERCVMYITIELQELHSSLSATTLFLTSTFEATEDDQEARAAVSSMKPVPLVLLITSVLLTTHIPLSTCRPRDLSFMSNQLDDVLLNRAGDDAMSYLLSEKLLQYLQRSVGAQKTGGVLHLQHFPTAQLRSPHEDKSLEEITEFSKRNDDPPISIDLTFHLLRNMIEMARNENQREQAGLNRKYLDEVGK